MNKHDQCIGFQTFMLHVNHLCKNLCNTTNDNMHVALHVGMIYYTKSCTTNKTTKTCKEKKTKKNCLMCQKDMNNK